MIIYGDITKLDDIEAIVNASNGSGINFSCRIKSRFIYKQVGQRLKQLRNQKGVSQKVVADYLGVDRSTYTNYEMGTTTMTYVTILMLARYFSVDFNTLLCYDLQTTNKRSEVKK